MLLLERARRLGVFVAQPVRVKELLFAGNAISGLVTDQGAILARYVIDATGRRAWLAEHAGLPWRTVTPPLTAWYGYAAGECPARDAAPAPGADSKGWTWVARVRSGLYGWTRLNFDGSRPSSSWRPEELATLHPCGDSHGAAVAWRVSNLLAGPGYFLVGDAAAILDPASSHGILKALMTGIMAGHLMAAVARGQVPPLVAATAYANWLHAWFDHEVRELRALYAALPKPPAWTISNRSRAPDCKPGLIESA
jgi:flavin-dependent dehydrogenase